MSGKKAPDRRIQRTRKLLQDSLRQLILEKGYESVTVQDIIDRADVGRSTFYAHFQDKEHLLLSGSEGVRDVLERFNQDTTEESLWDFTAALFGHAEDQRATFKAMLGRQAGAVVINYIRGFLGTAMTGRFRKTFSREKPAVPMDVFVEFLVSTFLGVLTMWLDTDARYSASQLNAYYRMLTAPALKAVFKPHPGR